MKPWPTFRMSFCGFQEAYVWGINIEDDAVCYTDDFIGENKGLINTTIGGRDIIVAYDHKYESVGAWCNDIGVPITQIDFSAILTRASSSGWKPSNPAFSGTSGSSFSARGYQPHRPPIGYRCSTGNNEAILIIVNPLPIDDEGFKNSYVYSFSSMGVNFSGAYHRELWLSASS